MTECIDVCHRRPPDRPSRRIRPNCLAAWRSLLKQTIISSGRLLRYIQVCPTPLYLMKHVILTKYVFYTFPILLGGADTVRLLRPASRVGGH